MSQSTPANSSGASGQHGRIEDRPLVEVRNRKTLIVAVLACSAMTVIDSTIANVALPHMKVSIGAANDTITWVLTSYIIASAVFLPMTGWLSERVGSRNLFIWATVVFLVASAACGIARGLVEMVLYRAVQGAAAAFMMPMTQTIMLDVTKPSRQSSTVSMYGAMILVAPILGPFLGGYLTENLDWRWVFYINLFIGIPAIAVLWLLLPSRPAEGRRLDLAGLLWLGLALISFQLMLDRGEQKDWFESPEIVIEAIVAASALWIYLIHTMSARQPLFSRSLFSNSNFIVALCMMFVMGGISISLMAILPTLLQNFFHFPVLDSGLMMIPRGVGMMVPMLSGARLMKLVDLRTLLFSGFCLAAGSMWSMSGWTLDIGTGPMIAAGLMQGIGLGLIFAPMNIAAFSSMSAADRPDGSSLFSLARSLGSSIGISLMINSLSRSQQIIHSDLAAKVTDQTTAGMAYPAASTALPGSATVATLIDAEINRQAAMIAYNNIFFASALMLLLMASTALLIRKFAFDKSAHVEMPME